MESDMRSIGELARASGLTVSALRFYDKVGVLVPAFVDPETGYRWYRNEQLQPARLVAALRRVGMPLPEIALVVAQRGRGEAVRGLLDVHLRRLEDGLADARRELSRVHAMLDHEEKSMTNRTTPTRLTLASADFAAALTAVRFAVGDDPDLPVLGGVLLEADGMTLRMVATDRYRLAVAEARAREVTGPGASVLAPVELLDRIRPQLDADVDLMLILDGSTIRLEAAGWQTAGQRLEHEFPDYRRLTRSRAAHRVTVDVAGLRQALATSVTRSVRREQDGVICEVSVLALDAGGRLAVAQREATGAAPELHVGVNREFLLEALAATGSSQLVLELDGPITPLAIKVPDDHGTFSILMPTRLP